MLLSDHERATMKLDKEQFDKLIELLTPGYELSKMFLEQHKAAAAAKVEPEPAKEPDPQTT